MTTAAAGANDLHVESPEERRAARTIKLFIVLGWLSETTFLFFGMIVFPQLHPSLIGRLIWTQILCGIGMGAATGAIAYLAASGFKQGSWPALVTTVISEPPFSPYAIRSVSSSTLGLGWTIGVRRRIRPCSWPRATCFHHGRDRRDVAARHQEGYERARHHGEVCLWSLRSGHLTPGSSQGSS